ncbi:MAG TPA: adenylate/guanylate cyclase domain-containing protein, partial [Nocardioidaceae bacterium]|nr:adenylate/guanylate cyclase domain-containing protein [Nocardioidaceae bacterium]
MPGLPRGTVTMLFSDIEGSTALLSRLGDGYAGTLQAYRALVRSVWSRWDGAEMGTEGDGAFVVFERATDAARAAIQVQRVLANAEWPQGEHIRVRIGLHTGEAVPDGEGYVGLDVHRAARVAAAAHGGQVVVTAPTYELIQHDMPADTIAEDLGGHLFKDFALPLRIYQLTNADLTSSFPPLRSHGSASSLPVPPTQILGRDRELGDLHSLLDRDQARLVTLTGAGGSGKTRLAIAFADARSGTTLDGVFFVPLAGVSTGDGLWTALGSALGLDVDSPERVIGALGDRAPLIVLDNLEQIPDAADVVSMLLSRAANLIVVATSRRSLQVVGEFEFAVDPLAVPTTDDSIADLAATPAVELFCRQAAMAKAGFSLTEHNAPDVAEICRRLDGLPLAIELAAARVKLLSPANLSTRLGSVLDLRSDAIDRPARQRALRDTIGWSFDLLAEREQQTLTRLGVFAGGADLDAIGAVTAMDDSDPLDAVAELVHASLVSIDDDPRGRPRVTTLQTVAEFARERLDADDDIDAVRRRHAVHYLEFARRFGPQIHGPRQPEAQQRLAQESDNLNAALEWALGDVKLDRQPDRGRLGMQLCAALADFWSVERAVPTASHWYPRALAADTVGDTLERAQVLLGLADTVLWIEPRSGTTDPSRPFIEESLAISRRLGDPAATSMALSDLAEREVWDRHLELASDLIEESERLARACSDPVALSFALVRRSEIELRRDNGTAALAAVEEVRRIALSRRHEAAVS